MAKSSFIDDMKAQIVTDPNAQFNVSVTENGALGYRTSGSMLVDALWKIPSLRKSPEAKIKSVFEDLFLSDSILSILFMFYVGDIRGGMGERNTFRTWFKKYVEMEPEVSVNFLQFIPYYSRWDIMWDLVGIYPEVDMEIREIITKQYFDDLHNVDEGKPVSLLGKWLPSYNASSHKTKEKAKKVAALLGYDLNDPKEQKFYRKTLSKLRKAIKVVETDMSSNNWGNIDYSAVPSKANLKYKCAFARHDSERFQQFINDVSAGRTKINSSVAFPVDIVAKYVDDCGYYSYNLQLKQYDPVLEEMWKALPSYNIEGKDIVCVVDTSGSMYTTVSNTSNISAFHVADSLGIYFAEHNTGAFKNRIITFSSRPQIIEFKEGASLHDRLNYLLEHSIVDNTNIEAVFNLILDTAVSNRYSNDDMPGSILIISDMEFDAAQDYETRHLSDNAKERLFNSIAKRYKDAGYKVPKLIFWNVNSRTNTIPVLTNENGVILVSGFSINTMKMVLSDELDPEKALLEQLFDERYQPIIDIIKDIM